MRRRWSHTAAGCGIPTQCVQRGKALMSKAEDRNGHREDRQYHAGLLLKINLKLGGENCYAITPDRVGQRDEGIDLMLREHTVLLTTLHGDMYDEEPDAVRLAY